MRFDFRNRNTNRNSNNPLSSITVILLIFLMSVFPMRNILVFMLPAVFILYALILVVTKAAAAKTEKFESDNDIGLSKVQRQYDRDSNDLGSSSQMEYDFQRREFIESSANRQYNNESTGSSTQNQYDKEKREEAHDVKAYYKQKDKDYSNRYGTDQKDYIVYEADSVDSLAHKQRELKDLLNAGIIDKTEYFERINSLTNER